MGGVAAHVLFDSGASHCFVQPEMIGIGEFQKEEEDREDEGPLHRRQVEAVGQHEVRIGQQLEPVSAPAEPR